MSDFPDPLVPAEVDLRDFAFMPLDVLRLRDSDLACVEDAEVFRCSVLSWCVSWHQVPAASLPDDDALLARLLGFGRDVKGWKRIRAMGGMRGWVLCSDGRLYHPVVVEKAREAWSAKVAQRARTEAARRAREAQRQAMSQSQPQSLSQTPAKSVTETVTESKGQGQGQGQGQGLEEKRERTPAGARSPVPDKPDDVDPQTWADWLALRKAKKAPVTATVLAGAVAEAAKAGMPLDAFLRAWCTRGTQGLQADWLKPHERPAVNGHPSEPAWRTEQRERTAAFAGRYAEKPRGTTTIPQEGSDAPEVLG